MKRLILFAFFALITILIVNSVYAQFDIQNFIPTVVPTVEEAENTDTASRPIISPRPFQCVNPGSLQGTVRVGNIVTGYTGSGTGRVWYSSSVGGGNLTAEELSASIKKIKKKTGLTTTGLRQQLERLPAEGAACITTGVSPTLFIYSSSTNVEPLAPILYLEENDQYLYYEYDSTNISFNKPKEGWVVDKSKLDTFVSNISNTLKLTSLESERLAFELNFSAVDVKTDKLFIGLTPQSEVDKNIPLKITSPNNPIVLRYHFYISSANEETIQPPTLIQIQRNTPFILEVGSYFGN